MKRLTADWLRAGGTTLLMFGVFWLTGAGSSVLVSEWDASPIVAAAQIVSQGSGITMPTADQVSVLQWAIREGGAFVVILVILFFYRRDWKTAVDFWKEQHGITTQLAKEATQAQTECSAAIRENTTVTTALHRIIDRQFPERRQTQTPQS